MRMNALVSAQAIRRGEKVGDIGRRRRFAHAADTTAVTAHIRRAFEEKCHRNLQDLRNLLQAAGANAVGALFVFLHLLKRQPERVAQFLLAHAEHHPSHAHAAADVLVDRIRRLLRHKILLCLHWAP